MSQETVGRKDRQGIGTVPRARRGQTTRFSVEGQKGYLIVGEDAGNRVGEVTIKVAKQGSALAGMMDALGTAVSVGLQAGAPLQEYVAEFTGTRFVPAGRTDDPDLPLASSLVDYVARRLAVDHLPAHHRAELGVLTAAERRMQSAGVDRPSNGGVAGS